MDCPVQFLAGNAFQITFVNPAQQTELLPVISLHQNLSRVKGVMTVEKIQAKILHLH
jgi:hypothetical protein